MVYDSVIKETVSIISTCIKMNNVIRTTEDEQPVYENMKPGIIQILKKADELHCYTAAEYEEAAKEVYKRLRKNSMLAKLRT